MTEKIHYGDIAGESGLPPREVWRINPEMEKIDTPVDDRGLIVVTDLIHSVKNSVDSSYQWPPHLSIHHLYWEDDWYSSAFVGEQGQKFRNLPVHKALLPRVFENTIHKFMNPPDVPDPDVMELRIEAWTAAEGLFRSVRKAVIWEKRARRREKLIRKNPEILPKEYEGEDIIGKEVLQDILERHFSGIERALERHEDIPPEFRLIEVSASGNDLASQLGKIIVPRALNLVGVAAA